jgi:hypothetical protein
MACFLVSDSRGDFIAAPAGYARNFKTGEIYRDGTDPHSSGPEMTRDSLNAYQFTSARYAHQQAAKLTGATVHDFSER